MPSPSLSLSGTTFSTTQRFSTSPCGSKRGGLKLYRDLNKPNSNAAAAINSRVLIINNRDLVVFELFMLSLP
jgi:hypothetical protein